MSTSTETYFHKVTAEKARPHFNFDDFALMHEMLRLGGDKSPADAEFRLSFSPYFKSEGFKTDDARGAFDYMLKHKADKVCYINLAHRKKGSESRGSLEDCYPTSLLCMDFDADHGVHKADNLAPQSYIEAVLDEFPFPWAMRVDTGGGLHAYLRLSESADSDEDDAELRVLLAEFFAHRFAQDSYGGADGVSKNRAHLMRAAGSIAAKPASKDPYLPVKVVQHDLAATVDAAELRAWLVASTPEKAVKAAKQRAVRKASGVAFAGDDPHDVRPGTAFSRNFALHEVLAELHELEVVSTSDDCIEMVWADEQRVGSDRTLITAEKSSGGIWRTWTWGSGTARALGIEDPIPTTTLLWLTTMLDGDHDLAVRMAKHFLRGTMENLVETVEDGLTPQQAEDILEAAKLVPIPRTVPVVEESVVEDLGEGIRDPWESGEAEQFSSGNLELEDEVTNGGPTLTIPDTLPNTLHAAVEEGSDFARRVCDGRFQVEIKYGRGETLKVKYGKPGEPQTTAAFIPFVAYRSRHIITHGGGGKPVNSFIVTILTKDKKRYDSEPLSQTEVHDIRAIAAKTYAPIAWPFTLGADFVNLVSTAHVPTPEHEYEHTGHITHEGTEMFITHGGAMTADGPLTSPATTPAPGLSEEDFLERPGLMGTNLAVLPTDVCAATQSIVDLLKLAPQRPEIFWLPILQAVSTLVNANLRCTILLLGETVSAKSMVAELLQTLAVPGPRTNAFPVMIRQDSLASTTIKAGHLRNLMLICDDYKTTGEKGKDEVAGSIVEYVATAAYGAQMDRADGSKKLAAKAPMKSSVLITAEKMPLGPSTANRALVMKVTAQDFAIDPLPGQTVAPVDAWSDAISTSDHPSQFMASILHFIMQKARDMGGMKQLEAWAYRERARLATKLAPRSRATQLAGFVSLGAVLIREWSKEHGVQDMLPSPAESMAMLRKVIEINDAAAVEMSHASRLISRISGQMDTTRSYLLAADGTLPTGAGPRTLVASGFAPDAQYHPSTIASMRKRAGWWSTDYKYVALSRTWLVELARSIPELQGIDSSELMALLRKEADPVMSGTPDKRGVSRASSKLGITAANRPEGLVFTPQTLGLLPADDD